MDNDEKIVHVEELSDLTAKDKANELLQKGWTLISVGTKFMDLLSSGYPDYEPFYVVGATQAQWDDYQVEQTRLHKNIDL